MLDTLTKVLESSALQPTYKHFKLRNREPTRLSFCVNVGWKGKLWCMDCTVANRDGDVRILPIFQPDVRQFLTSFLYATNQHFEGSRVIFEEVRGGVEVNKKWYPCINRIELRYLDERNIRVASVMDREDPKTGKRTVNEFRISFHRRRLRLFLLQVRAYLCKVDGFR